MTSPLNFRFTAEGVEHWGWDGIDGVNLSTAADHAWASASILTVCGTHGPASSNVNDRVYFILSGSGWFEVGGTRFDVRKGELVMVPRSTPYDFGSTSMELLLIDTPAYSEEEG